jgi:putative ATPase
MVEGGEDPKFIARRLIILAAEDIGLANPNALLLANACFQAVENVGWPESRIILSECTLYLASSPKGNAAYMAINKAQQLVQQTGNLSVPLPLRNAPSALMKELGYGVGYHYSHDHPGNFINQEFLPSTIIGTNFIAPGSSQKEQELADQIKKWWQDKYKF